MGGVLSCFRCPIGLFELASMGDSSIGSVIAPMTSQNGGLDGRHGSKMADSNPRWRPSTDKGHDL